jgi:hypothetical protein
MCPKLSIKLGAIAALVVACASRPPASDGAVRCSESDSDSALAVCRALDTLERGFQLPSRVLTIERTNDSYRIRTLPAKPNMLDGMGLVIVSRGGRILSVEVSDSL